MMPASGVMANLHPVAALSYLLLPVTGLLAFALSHRERVRFHGFQAIAIGTLWGLALYGASAIGRAVTVVVFLSGAVVWLVFLVATAAGRDPRLPGLARWYGSWVGEP